MEVLEYLQISNNIDLNVPVTIIEDCEEIRPNLKGVKIFFENTDMYAIQDTIASLGTTNAVHCSQLFKQSPKDAYKILLKKEGWDSFTEYFINKFGGIDAIFTYLNKSKTDTFISNQQDFYAEKETPLATNIEEKEVEENTVKEEENTDLTEIEKMVEDRVLQIESEKIRMEEKQEELQEQKQKQRANKELMGLIEKSYTKGSPFNISVNASDLAKWKSQKENHSAAAQTNKFSDEDGDDSDTSQLIAMVNGPPIQKELIPEEDVSFLLGNLKELVADVKEIKRVEKENVQEDSSDILKLENNFMESLKLYRNHQDSKFDDISSKLTTLVDSLNDNHEMLATFLDKNQVETLTKFLSTIEEIVKVSLDESRDNTAEIKETLIELKDSIKSVEEKIDNGTEQTLTNRDKLQELNAKFDGLSDILKELSDKFSEAFVDDDDEF